MGPLAQANFSTSTDPSAPEVQLALHPIQRLHTDLLTEIFIHCLPNWTDIDESWHPSVISGRKAPLLLCKVCSFWRTLAISTPQLWTMFIFDLNTHINDPTRVKSLPGDIRTWLGRSGTLPLTIRFLFYTHSASLVTDCLKALFDYSSRWESVLIETAPKVPWPFISVLPNLRGFHGGILPINEFPFTFAPSLTSLLLHIRPPNPISISKIPWHKLKQLRIAIQVSPSMTFELLKFCPLLERLSIHVGYSDNINGGSDGFLSMGFVSPIKQDKLRRLRLSGSSVIAEKLVLPVLEELTWIGMKTICDPYYSQFLDLFTRSKCRLTKLSLVRSKFTPDKLLEYLNHASLQSLKALYIEDSEYGEMPTVDHEILSRLTYSEEQDTTPLCPKLAELTLKLCYQSEVSSSADSLGRMVWSRSFGRPFEEQLKSLDLTTQCPISEEDNWLLEFARDKGGLKLSYLSRPEENDVWDTLEY